MKTTPLAEKVIYMFIILMSLAVLLLAALAPVGFLNTGAVYRGF